MLVCILINFDFRYYCIGKNIEKNQIIVGNKENLITSKAYVTQINWINKYPKELDVSRIYTKKILL